MVEQLGAVETAESITAPGLLGSQSFRCRRPDPSRIIDEGLFVCIIYIRRGDFTFFKSTSKFSFLFSHV